MAPVNDTVNAYFIWYKCVEHFNNVLICRSHWNWTYLLRISVKYFDAGCVPGL